MISSIQRIGFLAALCLALAVPGGARGGFVVLNGDSNTVLALNGTFGATPNDNAVFYKNLLSLSPGNTVGIFSGSRGQSDGDPAILNDFYNSLAGVSSSILSGPITAAGLADLSMLIVDFPDASFSASEAAAVTSFLDSGKTLYVIGDNNTITNVNAINGDLAAVGSGLRLVADIADNGVLAATTANHQVVSDPLTAGVGTFTYGGLGISLVTGGQALFLSSDGVSPFVAVERPSAVPEPTGLAILGVNILGMLGYMRIHRSRTSA